MTPEVTVVLPTVGRDSWIDAARSVLAERDVALELVVVDDAADPPVRAPNDIAGDSRVRMLRIDVRSGPAAARNRAHAVTRAPFIAYLDDDDAWLPGKLRSQLELLRTQPPSVAATECGYDLVNDEGTLILRYRPDPGRDLHDVLLRRPCMVPSTVLARREAIDELGGFDEELLYGQDWMLWLRLSRSYAVAVDDNIRVIRREHRRDPHFGCEHYPKIVHRISAELADQPAAEQRRVRAFHEVILASHLAGCGRRREAVTMILRGWRADPVQWRAPAHLLRALLGLRLWLVVETLARRAFARLHVNVIDRSW